MRSRRTHPADGKAVTIVAHDVAGAGGMERQVRELISGLLARGIRVTVVSRSLDLPQHRALRWYRVPGPARPFVVAYPWFALVASLILLRRREGPLHVTGAIVLNRAEVCTVHYLHNSGGTVALRMSRSPLPYRVNAWAARVLSRGFERLIYGRRAFTKRLATVTESLADEVATAFPRRAADVRVVHNGVDIDRFRPDAVRRGQVRQALELEDDTLTALFVGSEWRGKGADLAVEAVALASDWHLVVVGSGDVDWLTRRADDLGILARVRLVGETSEPERYYAAADALVLPSARETFSLAVLEAAAAGVPVVATDVGIVRSLVVAGGGLIVDRDSASVAAALRSLARKPQDLARMSRCAREYARGFDWTPVVDGYLALYSGLGPAPRDQVVREMEGAA
jgi:glycosyltransferase involved in cell wall biosynthesis